MVMDSTPPLGLAGGSYGWCAGRLIQGWHAQASGPGADPRFRRFSVGVVPGAEVASDLAHLTGAPVHLDDGTGCSAAGRRPEGGVILAADGAELAVVDAQASVRLGARGVGLSDLRTTARGLHRREGQPP